MSLSALIVSCVCGAVLIYWLIHLVKFYRDVSRRGKMIDKLPGTEVHPIWGTLNEFPGPGENGLIFMHERSMIGTGGIGRFWIGPFLPCVTLIKPETVRVLLKTSEPKPSWFGAYPLIKPWLGDGLLISHGKKWARNRRLLTPAFHFDILKPYISIDNSCTQLFLDKLDRYAATGEYFEVFNHVSLLTLDIMLRCAFSYQTDCQARGQSHPYVKAVTALGDAITHRFIRPWLYPDLIFYYLSSKGRQFTRDCNYVHSVSEDIIAKRRVALTEQGSSAFRTSRYIDFLDILLTAKDTDGQTLTDQEIRDEVDTFLFEGHDTTASAISWTLFSLAQHPECLRKCQQEVDELLRDRDSEQILWDDLNQLPYITMCLKEGMRLHCPVPYIQRQLVKDLEIEGFFIPAKTIVDMNLYILHHHPNVWKQPYAFIPERFSPENLEKMDPFAFVPFSAGPRNCIGQNFAMHEMKITIARTVRKFDLALDPTHETRHEIKVVMKTENGMYMRATPRI